MLIHPSLNKWVKAVIGLSQLPRWPVVASSTEPHALRNFGLVQQRVRLFAGEDPPSLTVLEECAESAANEFLVTSVGFTFNNCQVFEVTTTELRHKDWFVSLSLPRGFRHCIAAGIGIPRRGTYVNQLRKVRRLIDV